MKKNVIYSIFLCISLILLVGCAKESQTGAGETIDGELISHSNCKYQGGPSLKTSIPDTISKVEYNYNYQTQKLTLTHINAGFNCCPGTLSCDISLKGDTILISEKEEAALCRCDCLYDLEIAINDLEQRTYQIKFIEPYASQQEKLLFVLNLNTAVQGSYSVVRKIYPWGVGIY